VQKKEILQRFLFLTDIFIIIYYRAIFFF